MTTTNPAPSRREQLKARQEAETRRDTKRRTWSRIIGGVVTLIVVVVVGYGLWTAIPEQGDTQRLAPDFTLTTTAGATVTLSDLRPSPVLIYFNEGAGCASCTMQMAEIEKNPGFAQAGITVLPIVMNTAEQILPDMQQFGVTT
ncbi:redoxin, partial [Sorangium cellulosum]